MFQLCGTCIPSTNSTRAFFFLQKHGNHFNPFTFLTIHVIMLINFKPKCKNIRSHDSSHGPPTRPLNWAQCKQLEAEKKRNSYMPLDGPH
jgi:hypothetical protein